MCLLVDLALTEAFRRDLREAGGSCTVYKQLEVRRIDYELISPSMTFVWRPGWSQADGRPPAALEDGTRVRGGGFHVYLDRMLVPGHPVEFRALEQDFVGSGGVHAVFRRLYLSEESYLRAFQQVGCAPPAQRTASGERVLRGLEWRVFALWVERSVASGSIQRALIDVTARDPGGQREPSDPGVWVRQPSASGPKRVRRRTVRAIPLERLLRPPPPRSDPPAAA